MRKSKYNFDALEIDQETEAGTERSKISAAATMYGKRSGKKFSTRIEEGKVFVKRVS